MANWYVYSAAAGAGTGADWTNAYTTLAAACTAKAAGDTFFVAHDHAETQGSAITITSPGTEVTPCRIYCVNRAGSVPPVAADLRTTATITTTGSFGITLAGSVWECNGIIFNCSTGSGSINLVVGNTAGRTWRLVNCALKLLSTSVAAQMKFGVAGAGAVILENTTIQFGSTSQILSVSTRFIWRNTPSAFSGATFPGTLFSPSVGGASFFLEGVDLSAMASGKTLFNMSTAFPSNGILKDCKLGASVTIAAFAGQGAGGADIAAVRCDSGDTNYRTERYNYMGSQLVETTIVRTGGASDGTTPISIKIVTSAQSKKDWPYECLPISIWNETVGSPITLSIQGIWGGGAVPNNDDIWIDVEYLGTSGFPIASKATSGKATGLDAGSAIPAGSGTWGGSTTNFKMSATFTPQEKGPITIYVKAAAVSSTFYIDPKPELS